MNNLLPGTLRSNHFELKDRGLEEKEAITLFLRTRTEDAFSVLFASLYARVRRYFVLRGLEIAVSEELAQNVMLTVYLRIGDVRDEQLFYGWLFKIAKNELASYRRQQQTRQAIIEFEPLNEVVVARLAIESMESSAAYHSNFSEWVAQLEPSEREIIVLRYVEELSYEDLSVALQIPIGTVKWRLYNAKKKLSRIIGAAPLISLLHSVN